MVGMRGVFAWVLLGGCVPTLGGAWNIDMDDADDCSMELEVEQVGDDVDGEADVDCLVYLDGGNAHRMEEAHADVDGDRDGDDFVLRVSFFEDGIGDIEFELDGGFDAIDTLEGDAELNGADFGDFSGER